MQRCKDDGNGDNHSGQHTLLFSAQLFLNCVELQLPLACGADLLVGFQLLQYEIVLFDAPRISSNDDGNESAAGDDHHDRSNARITLALDHGKSCLFDADADHLALDLQRTEDAPLVLLVMQQEHGKARLVAFASIPIELHAGLVHTMTSMSDDGTRTDTAHLSDAMRYRVCEWASGSGSWELRDHASCVVGVATGAFTLSCLGRALAPHIAKAIGLRVNMAKQGDASTAPTDTASECAVMETGSTRREVAPVKSPVMLASPTAAAPDQTAQRVDTAVQCDDERFVSDEDDAYAGIQVMRAVSSSGARVFPGITFESMQMRRAKPSHSCVSSPTSSASPNSHMCTRNEQQSCTAKQRKQARTGAPESELFTHTLPPPLFFHKPAAARAKR